MLLTKNLINGADERYIEMLKSVNIPDFTKCIAEFSGLSMEEIDDEMIKEYLLTWAKNKYRFYKMLGNKTRVDNPFVYKKFRETLEEEIKDLGKEYPAYALWLDAFDSQTSNKIDTYPMDYRTKAKIRGLFPQYKLDGSLLTHFFKRMLNAPDEFVTKLARVFENDEIKATHTISIDPVDIMLASENPYDWQSCYRLETLNSSSHADGCMAALIDTTSLITYVWNNEGKLDLYEDYELKNVRYKRLRQWIAISNTFTTVHFNTIYPGKNYEDKLEKQMRDMVETHICKFLGIRNMWRQASRAHIDRYIPYGYNEFHDSYLWVQSDAQEEDIQVYNYEFRCACGCGCEIEGSDGTRRYVGEGFHCDPYTDEYYCELLDDYCCCECCAENCCDCDTWIENHPTCSLDETEECPNPNWDYTRHGVMEACTGHCEGCSMWEAHHMPDEDDDIVETTDLD